MNELNYFQLIRIPYYLIHFFPSFIDIKKPSDGSAFTANYVIAVIHDRDAFGIYQIDETVLTTPVNAAGAYYNQFWHEKQGRFVDTSENLVIFTLN